jgi:hypothetical protein
MLSPISIEMLQPLHRYFITDGTNLYFGTYLTFHDECIKLFGKKIPSMHGENVMYFDTTRYFKYTCYTFVPCKMEQVLLNKILQKITGDSTFCYRIETHQPFILE